MAPKPRLELSEHFAEWKLYLYISLWESSAVSVPWELHIWWGFLT